MRGRRRFGIALCLGLPACVLFGVIQEMLLSLGVLNTKDLKYVAGAEIGSVADYLLNAWCWDAVMMVMLPISLLALLCGLLLFYLDSQVQRRSNP